AHAFEIIKNGTYTLAVRSLARKLVSYGCPIKNTGEILGLFFKILCPSSKKEIRGPSPRTVGRALTEGGIASEIQLGFELRNTQGNGDGTTNKNQNFESMHINLTAPKEYTSDVTEKALEEVEHKVRFAGVRMSGNHRAETQKNGDIACLENAVEAFNNSPLGRQLMPSSS
ncbi:uncharacterized protein FOMMEDRAFT_45457, partial [Fomitiporia mediterranea MF3/22]